MTYILNICIMLSILSLFSCGGGGGVSVSPEVLVNQIHVSKLDSIDKFGDLVLKGEVKYPINIIKNRESWIKKNVKLAENLKAGHGHKPKSRFSNYHFIASDKRILQFENTVLKNTYRLPRYQMWMDSMEVEKGDENYLLLFIEQQKTSFSSSFLIFNTSGMIVYRENIDGGFRGAKKMIDMNGQVLITLETHDNSLHYMLP